MCVILFVDEKRPSEEFVRLAWKRNDHGGGYAHRIERDGKRMVKWAKDLSLDEMIAGCLHEWPLPYVAHFRIASSGGICGELCHPFTVDREASVAKEGETSSSLLFHNGDWKQNWNDLVLKAAIKMGHLPEGPWSDTRAMAFLSHVVGGTHFMDFIGHKGIAFGPDEAYIYAGKDGWHEVGPDKIWCSNDYFFPKPVQQYKARHCKSANCNRMDGLSSDGYCPKCEYNRREAAKQGANQAKNSNDSSDWTYCFECQRRAHKEFGDGHAATCRKATKAGPLVCHECRQDLIKGGHVEGCEVAKGGFGTAMEKIGTGGSRLVDPFSAVLAAEGQHTRGEISKNELKRVWKRLIGTNRNEVALREWQAKAMGLKDPRVEVVTH